MNYDNPNLDINYLKNLSPVDRDIYTKGYLRACSHILDAFTQTKTELLTLLLGAKPDTCDAKILTSSVKLLDFYEALVEIKVANTETTYPQKAL